MVMLLFTSYLDLRKREVEDKVWIAFGALGAVLEAYEILTGVTSAFSLFVSVGLAALVGFSIFYFGFYGGADAKALMVLAVLVPYFKPNVGIYQIVPLIVLTNGVLLSMTLPVALFLLNISRVVSGQKIFDGFDESRLRKLLACFLGYRSTGKPRAFQFPMEKTSQSNNAGSVTARKRFDFSFMQDEFEKTPGTWVTPGIPLLVFFTFGFLALLTYGDIVIGLISLLARIF